MIKLTEKQKEMLAGMVKAQEQEQRISRMTKEMKQFLYDLHLRFYSGYHDCGASSDDARSILEVFHMIIEQLCEDHNDG